MATQKETTKGIVLALMIVAVFGVGTITGMILAKEEAEDNCDQRVEQAQNNVSMSYEKLPAGWYEVVEAIPERQVALVSALDRSEYIPPFVVREMPTKLTKGKKFQTRSRPYTGR